MELSRRSLLSAAMASLVPARIEFHQAANQLSKKPKNIIFCVADGMADSVPAMLDVYQQIREGRRSTWLELISEPGVTSGLQSTRSLNSVVTDSSAASSAWGGGRRVWNGMLNMYPDETVLTPISELLASKGVRTGLVTTATVTHATPAGFALSHWNRDEEAVLAEKYLKAPVDVLLGGGNQFFAADKRADKRDLYEEFRKAGFAVHQLRETVRNHAGGKVLGIFGDGHLPYTIDRDHSEEITRSVPTLAEMSEVALRVLKDSPGGFLLQIEAARVDHAGHANDFGAIIHDQRAFDEAVAVAIDFAKANPDTLVIITSDHGCGGPSLNGDGEEYIDSTAGLMTLQNMKSSYGAITREILADPKAAKVRETVQARLGFEITTDEAELIAKCAGPEDPFRVLRLYGGLTCGLGMLLSNHTKVSWNSKNHTAEHMVVSAMGPGSELISSVRDNTDLFDLMLSLKEVDYQKPPQMSFEDAAKHYEALKKKHSSGTEKAVFVYDQHD